MINLDDIQQPKQTTPTANQQTKTLAPLTQEQLVNLLFNNTVKTILGTQPTENSKDSQKAAYQLALQIDENGTQALADKIKALHLSFKNANDSSNENLMAATNLSAQYVMTFIRRLASTFNRGAAILYMTDERRKTSNDPASISCPIPEFDSLELDKKQINHAVKEVNNDLQKAYGYVLSVANDWAREFMGTCPMGSTRDSEGNYHDLTTFKEVLESVKHDYKDRENNAKQALDILK